MKRFDVRALPKDDARRSDPTRYAHSRPVRVYDSMADRALYLTIEEAADLLEDLNVAVANARLERDEEGL